MSAGSANHGRLGAPRLALLLVLVAVLATVAGSVSTERAQAFVGGTTPVELEKLLAGKAPYQSFLPNLLEADPALAGEFLVAQSEAGLGASSFELAAYANATAGGVLTTESAALAAPLVVWFAIPVAVGAAVYIGYHVDWSSFFGAFTDPGLGWAVTGYALDFNSGYSGYSLNARMDPSNAGAPAKVSNGSVFAAGYAAADASTPCHYFGLTSSCKAAPANTFNDSLAITAAVQTYLQSWSSYHEFTADGCPISYAPAESCTAFDVHYTAAGLLRQVAQRGTLTQVEYSATDPTAGDAGTVSGQCTIGSGACVTRGVPSAVDTITATPALADAIDVELAGDPGSAGTITVPDCTGKTYGQCVTALRAAGLLGSITRTLGDPGIDGDPIQGPGRVQQLQPEAGSQAEQYTELKIDEYANPDGTDPTPERGDGDPPVPGPDGHIPDPGCTCPPVEGITINTSDRFPFAVFGYLSSVYGALAATPTRPDLTLPVHALGLNGAGAQTDTAGNVHLAIPTAMQPQIDGYMSKVREWAGYAIWITMFLRLLQWFFKLQHPATFSDDEDGQEGARDAHRLREKFSAPPGGRGVG